MDDIYTDVYGVTRHRTSEQRVLLPGRKILGDLINTDFVYEVAYPPHKCTGKISCPDPSHKRRTDGSVYFHDERLDSPFNSRHILGVWTCYYMRRGGLHPDLVAAWESTIGPNSGDYAISALRLIPWRDGRMLLTASPRGRGWNAWITIQAAEETT